MIDPLLYTQGMTDAQRLLFTSEYNGRKKNTTPAILLALCLGGVGGHHFYMGRVGLGVLYLVFFWTLIPAFVAFIELFLMSGRVERYNEQVARDVAERICAFAPATPATA